MAEAATDYVLDHGLIGLSLRPLAAAVGTSDRMLLYHFAGKDDLVAAVLRVSNDRSVREIRALPPARDVHTAVLQLWTAMNTPVLLRCQRMYVEAAALGLFGREPYVGVVGEANRTWMAAVDRPPGRLRRAEDTGRPGHHPARRRVQRLPARPAAGRRGGRAAPCGA